MVGRLVLVQEIGVRVPAPELYMISEEQKQLIFELETSLHKKEVRNSHERVSELLTEDFIEFGKSGKIYSKQDILERLTKERVDLEIKVSNFEVKKLAESAVLATYSAWMFDIDNNSHIDTLRSSIWVHTDDQWKMIFHQGTPTQQS